MQKFNVLPYAVVKILRGQDLSAATNQVQVHHWGLTQGAPLNPLEKTTKNAVHRKYLVWEKIGTLWAIRQNFPCHCSQIRTLKCIDFGIYTNCSLFAIFFLANSFDMHGSPKFSPAKYFPCTALCLVWVQLVWWSYA